MSKEKETLADIDGWENSSDFDFFGDVTKEKTLEVKETEELPEEEKEEEKTDFFFDDNLGTEEDAIEDEEGVDTIVDKKTIKKEKATSIKTIEFLKEKGILDFELEEGQELTDELADEILESNFEDSIEKRVDELITDLPPLVKNIIKYAKDGGDIQILLSQLSTSGVGINKDLDISKEENQILVMKQSLKEDGYDDDYIETNIDFLKDSGRLENTANKMFQKIVKKQDEIAIVESNKQKAEKIQKIERLKQYKKDITNHLTDSSEIGGFKFSTKEKRELPNYISDQNIKMENGNVVSSFQKDIFDAIQDKNKTLILAKLLKSNFDISSLVKTIETEKTREIKKDLQNNKTTSDKKVKKSLSDYF